MSDITINTPAPIVVQVKGGKTTAISSPTGSATRLVDLSDVDTTPLANGDVLTYISANAAFEFHPGSSPGGNAFGVVNIAGQNNVVALTSSDTLELVAGTGILLTTDNVNNAVTIVATGGSATDQFARDQANGAFNRANNAYANANTAIYTAAQIRANISNTAPINYAPATGVISHADSGVVSAGHGDAATVPKIVVDAQGHVTSITNTAIAIAAAAITSGTLVVARGGTGQTSYSNGELLIGNTASGGLDRANLTQGFGVLITNANGYIKIEAAGGRSYYLNHTNTADVAGYHTAPVSPSPNPENVVVTLCTTALAFNLVGSYITDPGEPNTNLLPEGLYGRHIHAITDGASNVARLRFELYKRAANNLETLLRTNDSPDFNSTNAFQLLSWNITDPVGHQLDVTDRFVFKLYAARVSGGSGSVNVTIYFEGQNRASYITTSILNSAGADVTARAIANAAYAQANAAYDKANAANVLANTANTVAASAYNQANIATTNADAAFTRANLANDVAASAYANANTAIYTASQIRANISNTTPILYDSATGVVSLTTVPVSKGGTGQTAITVNGSLLISNTVSGGFDVNTLAEGTGIVITNDKGSITIAATGGSAIDQYARDKANGAAQNAFVTLNVAGQSDIVADSNTDTLTLIAGTGIVITTDAPNDTITFVATGGSATDQFARDTANGAFIKANGAAQNVFITINVAGQNNVIADSNSDTLILVAGTYTSITTDDANDTITIGSTGDQFARDQANAAYSNASAAFEKANGAIYTAAQIRANLSNTAPVNYDSSTGVISHADSGATPTTYGNTTFVPTITVDVKGHVTSIVNTAINFPPGGVTSVSGKTGAVLLDTYDISENLSSNLWFTAARVRANISNTAPINYAPATGVISHADSGVVATGHGDAATIPKVVVDTRGHVTSVTNTAIAIASAAVSESAGGPFFHTAARVRGNVTNTAPINYDATTGTFSHALSGATPSGYGDAATVPKVVVDDKGHVSSVVNTAIAISAAAITSGTLAVARGGTGQTAITVNGSLLIGNTVSGGFDVNALTQGSGIQITNDKGSITIAATGGAGSNSFGVVNVAGQSDLVADQANDTLTLIAGTGIVITTDAAGDNVTIAATGGSAIDQYARDKANGAAQNAFVTLNVAGQSDIVADSNTDTLVIVGSGIVIETNASTDTLTIRHPASGVTPSGYGDAATVPKVVVDANGHITSVVNAAIAISATQITSGTLAVARGGTGQTAITVNGSLLIGNTVSGGFDVNPITATSPVVVTNDKGSIALTHATSGVVATGHGDAATVPKFTVDDKGHVTAVTNTTIAITSSQVSESAGGPFFHTAARVRGNVTNTAPINYDATTGTFSHADSGVVATGHGDAATVPKVVVDGRGHITSVTNTSIAISAAAITSGTLAVARGGTGQTAITVNGSLLIGNTVSGGFDVNPITATSPVVVTNDKGSIALTHATSGVVATGHGDAATVPKFIVDDKGHVTSVTNTTIAITSSQVTESAGGPFFHTAARVRGNVTNTAPINYDATTGTFSHADSGVVATGHGDGATVPKFIVNATGHVTSVTNTAIAISAAVITSGTLAVARGGTGQTAITVNGSLLIGNTVSGGFDVNAITVAAPILIANGKGSISISHDVSGVTATGYGTPAQVPVLVVDASGHLTSVTNTSIAIATAAVSESAGGPFFHTAARVRGNVTNTAPINYDATTGTFSHALSGVVATGHGDAATVPKFTVDDKGHVTSVTNTAIAISASQITSGTLVAARGGTGQTAITLNGAILIANTVSAGYDLNRLTAGTGILINNDKGSIEIVATGGSATDQFARDVANGAFAKANTIRKSITVTSPVVTDNITFFFTDIALTFTKVVSVVRGTATPNVVFNLTYESSRHVGADRTDITGNITCANTTNGVFTTTFANATVPVNNYVTLTCSTVSGTVEELAITMIG